jgi:2,4-diketo-3-deoxy-L-fuconate hydrolase
MRIANLRGRAVLLSADGAVDIESASNSLFSSDPQALYERFEEFTSWAATVSTTADVLYDVADLGAPVPAPRQVFAIGLNYRDHAAESNFAIPDAPVVFTKYASCLTGPAGQVQLVPGKVDWEAELVVVIGRGGHDITVEDAWDHVAGLTIGQDLSERDLQRSGPAPQFSLGKSFPGFGPTGPAVVSVDELGDPNDLAIGSILDGEKVQDSRTSLMIFSVAELISRLSAVVTLYPGDLIFTGTPAGVGLGRTPQRFIEAGAELRTFIDGLGEMRHTFLPVSH